MAAIDKMQEFYTCLARFAFLSECYAPEEITGENYMGIAFKAIKEYSQRPDIRVKIEEAEEYFDEGNERIEMMKRKDFISDIVKECCR